MCQPLNLKGWPGFGGRGTLPLAMLFFGQRKRHFRNSQRSEASGLCAIDSARFFEREDRCFESAVEKGLPDGMCRRFTGFKDTLGRFEGMVSRVAQIKLAKYAHTVASVRK